MIYIMLFIEDLRKNRIEENIFYMMGIDGDWGIIEDRKHIMDN